MGAIGRRQAAGHGIGVIGAQRLVLLAVVHDVVAVLVVRRWQRRLLGDGRLHLLLWMADVIPHLMAAHLLSAGR